MGKLCLAIRHVAFEDIGMFGAVLAGEGYELRYLDAGVDRIDPDAVLAADLLVVLGGPIGVYEERQYPFLNDEIDAIRQRVSGDLPTLGVCLGLQLISAALGSNVGPGPAHEIGWAPVSLTPDGKASPLAPLEGIPVLHWHRDLSALPEGATRLAETEICLNQAYSIGTTLLALQFHIEADPRRIEQWLIGHSVELENADVDPSVIRRHAARFGEATGVAGADVLRAWLAALPEKEKSVG